MPASIYQPGTAFVTASQTTVHVGSPGTATLDVANTAAAGADSEALIASLSGATGGFGFTLNGFTTLADPAGSGSTFITGINDEGTVIGYYTSPSTGTGTANQNAAAAGTALPASFTWSGTGGYTAIASIVPQTANPGNNSTIPPNPGAPDGYSYVASGISGTSAKSYFGAGANPVFNGTIVLGTAEDLTGTANDPYYGGYGANALIDSAQARTGSDGTVYPAFATPAYVNIAFTAVPGSFLTPSVIYAGPGISQNGAYASLTEITYAGADLAVGDFGTGFVQFTSLGTLVGATNSWATGVNDSHDYVGTYENAAGAYQGFTGHVDATGTFVFDGTFDVAGATNTFLTAIDDNGDIAGYYTDAKGVQHGFADYKGVVTTIDLGAGSTDITGINDSGEIVGTYLSSAGGSTVGFEARMAQSPTIAAGGTSSVTLGFSTATAGTITGTAVLDLTSDGSVVTGDTNGLTSLGTVSVPVSVVVDNYATAALSEVSGAGSLTPVPSGYVLNLGAVLQGATVAPSNTLAVTNSATGTADLLSGSFAESGNTSAFINSGLAVFSGLAAGASAHSSVSLSTAQAGTFTETVTLTATGSNAGGYSGALAPEVITVVGTVVAGISLTGVTAANATAAAPFVVSVAVADTAADVAANLSALEALAVAGTLKGISLTGSGTAVLTVTAAQLVADAAALALITGNYAISVTGVTAANAASVAAEPHVTAVTVSDSAADVVANLPALETLAAAGTLTGISLTDGGTPVLTITETQYTADTAALALISGSYDLSVTGLTPSGNFTGDGTSAVLFQNTNQELALWTVQNGVAVSSAGIGAPATGWSLEGTGDFYGTGTTDLLFENSTGEVAQWQLVNGQPSAETVIGVTTSAWTIAGTGDFYGNGTDDILFRNANGDIAQWEVQDGKAVAATTVGVTTSDWSIAAIGSLSGAGADNIIFINSNGAVADWDIVNGVATGAHSLGQTSSYWSIVGLGDFTGNGQNDILFRGQGGQIAMWLTQNGQVVGTESIGMTTSDWQIVGLGDYNGDGTSDILFENTSGALAVWEMRNGHVADVVNLGSTTSAWHAVSAISGQI